jgi:hypothetical protein
MKSCTKICTALCCSVGLLRAGTFTAEYSSVKYDKAGSVNYALSIPTRNGQPLPAIRGVVISNPGVGGSTAFQVNERWAKWLFENGFAYLGNDSAYSTGSLAALADYADDDLGGITYPELANAPVFVFGESAGGSSTTGIVYANPERVMAFVVEHTRFFMDVDEAADPAAVKSVPGYFRWGEWDHSRFNEGYLSAGGQEVSPGLKSAKAAIHSMIARGAQWMTAIEHRQDHATKRYAFEEAMGFFGLMLPLRYDYQAGVAGKDPKLGAVNLIPIAREDGYLGEHLFGAIQSKVTLNEFNEIDSANSFYPNFLKDWESRDPYVAPFSEFTRLNKDEGHSWMANADVAAFWATKFSQGHHDLHVGFTDLISDAFGASSVFKNNSLFPNYFHTGQTIRVHVDPADFPDTQKVEFYANGTLKGTVENAPYAFTYTFDSTETGMFALYPVAIASNGERCVGPRRMVQVYPETRGANTAPSVSAIGTVTGNPNQTLSIPFTVGDADGDALTVVWREVNRANITSGSYSATIGGSGTNRTLDLTLPATPGIIWGIVQVSDGDMSTNSYVTIHVKGDGSAAPFFVANEAVGADGRTAGEHLLNGWTRRISVRVYDYDTDSRDLTLTATSDNQAAVPDENIRIGGAGEYRYLQVKQLGFANITMTLSDGNTSVSETFSLPRKTQDNTVPVLSAIPDQTASFSNASEPIEVRIYDLHTPNEEKMPGEPILSLAVTSGNPSIIQDAKIHVTQVGPRRLVSFTPEYNQTGTVTLTATVTDADGLTAATTFDVAVSAPPALSVPGGTLDSATITQSYTGQLTAAGGIQPYTWSLASGSLPTGLTLQNDGTLTGTPSETGSFTFTAQATDSDPGGADSESGVFTLDVRSLLTPPQDFSATAETDTTITLTWSDTASGETGYEIERRVAGEPTWVPLATTSANAVIHTDSAAVAAGTEYEYRLRAVGTHNGVYTDTVNVTAIGTPVVTAQPQSAAVLSGNSVIFSVTATGGGLSYQWYEGNSGDTGSPVTPGGNASTLTVDNITGPRTFWVRVSNPAGSADSAAATVSISQQAPSLKVNLGADLGGTWNSYATFGAFNGKLSETFNNLLFTSGANADGVSLTMTRSSTNEPFCVAISDQTATAPSSDWLTDAAAQSFWFINFNNGTPPHQLAFSVAGLPAGTYDLEVYVYVDPLYGTPANAYKFNPVGASAGINGAVAATDNPFDSASYNATATGSAILRWTNLSVEAGQTVDLRTELPFNSKMPVLNAFIIKGLALAVEAPSIDTQPAGVTVNEGEGTTLTASATTSGGALSYQWYQGVSGDTSIPVGSDSDSFTTPVLSETTGYWVRVSDDNGSADSDTAVVTVQQSAPAERILFIGNSFTNGYVDPAQSYNAANVTDLNGSGYGGVPGIFAKIAGDSGVPVEVGIESVNGSTLLGRYPSKVGLVTDPAWDRSVLQARSQEAMLDGRGDGASASVFNTTVGDWQTAILNAVPQARIWLYAPWASPTYVGEDADDYYSTAEGTGTFLNEINTAYENGFTTLGLDGWVPVGQAFADAAEAGLTELYHIDDHHANAAGSYLAAVMMYRQLLGGDPRLLPTGPGSAPADLGLTAFQVETIHQIAYAFEFPTVQPLPPSISSQPEDTSILTGESAALSVVAVGESLTYQWYEGVSGDTSVPVAGATSDSLTTPVMNTEGTVEYWVRVSNANGTVDSQAATVTVTAPNPTPATSWEAYHNTEALVANPQESLVSKGNAADTAYNLVKYADGTAADGATVTLSYTQTWTMNGSRAEAVMPDAGTDAHTLFDGKLGLSGRTTFVSATNSPTAVIRFDNLDPESTYAVRMTLNRGVDYKDTQFELIDASASTAASSAGIQIISATQVAMNSLNTSNGYVAGWDDIVPSGSSGTSFAVRIVPGPQQNFIYLPQLIRLSCTSSAPAPGTYGAWLEENSLNGADAEDLADPDNDGVVNRMEYALGLNPNLDQGTGMPTGGAVEEGGQLYQTFRFRRNREATDLTYVIEGAGELDDPSAWQPLTIAPADETVVVPDVDGDGKVDLVEVKVNVTGFTLHFLRLQAVR